MSTPINANGNSTEAAQSDRAFFGHPRGLSTLFFTEMWERFSYYGIRPLLVIFMSTAIMSGGFGIPRSQASAIVGIYAASVYLASLPGGWVADRLLGLRRAIMTGAVLIACGHLSIGLSAFAHGRVPFFLGLIFIVLGTGLLKPNISAIVGDLYPEGGARRDSGFSIFYMGINGGAVLGQTVTGLLGERYGYHWGFGAAGVGMLIGVISFAVRAPKTLGNLGLDRTRHPDPAIQARQELTVKLTVGAGLGLLALVVVLAATGVIHIDPQAVGKSMTYVLVSMAVFYFGYVFIFNLFAKDLTNRNVAGFVIPITWFQNVNSIFIVLLAPFFAALWLKLGKRGANPSSPLKFAFGLLFGGVGFGVMIFAAYSVLASNGTIKVSAWWLVVSYIFQTFGELCLSPVGLSSMTKLSPRKYVGQMMGIWFLATALGNLIAGLVGGNVDPEKLDQMPKLFIATTISLVAAGLLLAAMSPLIKKFLPNKAT